MNQLYRSKHGEDLKTKFLNKYCPPGRTAKKMEEINNFQQESDETLSSNGSALKDTLMKCPQHYLTEMQEVILFYNGLDIPTRQILDSRGVIPTKTAEDAKKAIQEMAEYSQKWHNGTSRGRNTETSDGLAAIQATLNNLGREIKKVNEKVYAAQDGSSVSVMPLSTYLNLGLGELAHTRLTVELADRTVKYPKGIAKNILVGNGPFLSTAHAKIDVYKRNITLKVGEEKIIFKSVKSTSSIIKRVYMLSLRERTELDLEARLMGETLVLNRSLDPFLEDYIELNNLNEPVELRINQGDEFDVPPMRKESLVRKNVKMENPRMLPNYKGSTKELNLGPEYILNAKKKEWITRGHISMHEME
ncbi:retrovirus-related pol polyprotein from transposon TNT 1-94 [Tanacetum coccineum]